MWPLCYPKDKTERLLQAFREGAEYLVQHQISSGHSFGVFDLEYRFKRDESKPDGKLYWDVDNVGATADELLEQMDFPLVSVAMSYDGNKPLDMAQMAPLINVLPLFASVYHYLTLGDARGDDWKPTGPNQVLMRNATATRRDAEGHGLMRKLAEFLKRYAAEQGFRGINIECLQDAVTKVWLTPPSPFKGTLASEFRCDQLEEDREVDGEMVKIKLFAPSAQRITRIFVDLKPHPTNGHLST